MRNLPFSLSGLGRAIECPAHLVLPHTQTVSPYQGHGSVVHDYLERVRSMGPDEALKFVPEEHRGACEILDTDNPALALDPSAYAAEVAFAYNVRTGEARELGRGMGRDYSGAREDEVCGTADVVGLTDEAVIIIDYKTGWADLGPLWQNWQLKAYALAAARTYGRKKAVVFIVRVNEGREPWASAPTYLSELDLEVAAAEIEALVDKVARVEDIKKKEGTWALPTSQGPWCKYCPAVDRCPSKISLVAAAVRGELPPYLVHPAPVELTAEQWAVGVGQIELLEQVLKRMKSALEDRATAQPIPLGSDDYWGPKKTVRRWIDAERSRDILVGTMGVDVTRHIKADISFEALKKLAATAVQGKKDPETGRKLSVSKYVDSVFEKLESEGFAGTKTTYTVGRVKADKLVSADNLQPKEKTAE